MSDDQFDDLIGQLASVKRLKADVKGVNTNAPEGAARDDIRFTEIIQNESESGKVERGSEWIPTIDIP